MSLSNDLTSTYTSPKRKRGGLEPSHRSPKRLPRPATTKIDAPSRPQRSPLHSEEGSPRAAVSSQFEDLNLEADAVSHINFGKEGNTAIASKRLKPNHKKTEVVEDQGYNTKSVVDGFAGVLEIPETPDQPRTKASWLNDIDERLPQPASHFAEDEILPIAGTPTRAKARKISPSPFSPRKSSPEPESLTWRDDEITGHDPTDPDDDGYGLNCIGFKPTPAIAYARTQHRKQQILEWKTREAREARQKRTERRRGVVEANKAGLLSEIEEGRRKVRFEEGQA